MSGLDYYIDTACNEVSDFDSGYPIFNDYLLNRDDSAVMHYIIEVETKTLIAYFALLSSAALYGELIHIGSVPAIELKMFAMDKKYQKKGVANILLESIMKVIEHYSTECVGQRLSCCIPFRQMLY